VPPLRKSLAIQRGHAVGTCRPFSEPRGERDLQVSLPAQPVRQRPDVRSDEEQLHSARAGIGVAVANMLPSLTLSAGRGYTH
jgi:outer membrane protein TolC